MIMLTSKQRNYLRTLANSMQPIFQIGKGGINDNMVRQFNEALESRELIKITILRNSGEITKDVCEEVSRLTESDVVQVIGNRFTIYKESEKNKTIILP